MLRTSSGGLRIGFLILILAASLIVYLPALRNGFVGDDQGLIVNNTRLGQASFLELFGQEFARGATAAHELRVTYYRPLVNLSFWLDRRIWGLNPLGFHLHNLLLNLIAAFLVYLLLLRLIPRPLIAGPAGLLFALHPMHAESVAFISARTDLLMSVLILLAFYFLLAVRPPTRKTNWLPVVLAAICFALALLAKETAIMFAAFPPIWLLLFDRGQDVRRDNWVTSGAFILVAVIHFALRTTVLHSAIRVTPNVAASQFPALMLNTFGLYLKLFFLPFWHVPYYPFDDRFLSFTGYALAALGYIIGAAILFRKWRSPVAPAGFWWGSLFLVPVLNLLFLSGPLAAERFLYLPSFGFVLLLGAIADRFGPRLGPATYSFGGCAAVLAVLFGINTARYTRVWHDDLAFGQAMTAATPDFAMAHNSLGVALENRGDLAGARREFQAAVGLNPDYALAHNNLGSIEEAQGDLNAALSEYRLAVQGDSLDLVARNNLGSAFGALGMTDSAIIQFRSALNRDPENAEAHNNLGVALNSQGDIESARREFIRAVQLRPDYLRALINVTRLLLAQGKKAEAGGYVDRARRLAPNDPTVRSLLPATGN